MMMDGEDKKYVSLAWIKLIRAYLVCFFISLGLGFALIYGLQVLPEKLIAISTQRLAAAGAVLEKGMRLGIDAGLLLFAWNISGALATLSFLYTASLIDPRRVDRFPRLLRKALCGRKPMRALCYLPGCARMNGEPLRRLFVWLMVPLLGMVLLGVECGLIVAAVITLSGSAAAGFFSLLPHGIIEIPAFALAGAVPFSGHLLVKQTPADMAQETVFDRVRSWRKRLPIGAILFVVVLCLLLAGLIEAHVTPVILERFKQ